MLETAESFYGPRAARMGIFLPDTRHAEYPLRMRTTGGPEPRGDEVVGFPIRVVVNHGRWLVLCPRDGCGDAQHASRDDHRFFCLTCHNDYLGVRWCAVEWPEDPDAVDAALSVRPVQYRNWNGEPVDVLLADNADPVNGA